MRTWQPGPIVSFLWSTLIIWILTTTVLYAECPPPVLQSVPASVPREYRGCFVHYVDNRSLSEKALNVIGLSSQDVGRSFALIAGVTQFPNMAREQQQLKPAAEDLRRLQAYLRDQEFFDEIVVLQDSNMSYQTLRYFLEVYFPARLRQSPKSRFLFAYSGHGMTEGSMENPFGYLLLSTARHLNDKENGISMDVIRTFVDRVIDAGHQVLILINACHSGVFLNRRPFGDPGMTYLPREKGAHVVTASGSGQLSWHDPRLGLGSVFFEKFLAGLGGQADTFPIDPRTGQHGDGIITANEIGIYLREEVPMATRGAQIPLLADIAPHRSLGAFFFLNRQKQIARGIVPDWDQTRSSPLGILAAQDLIEAKRLYDAHDYVAARRLFEQMANAGNAEAMRYLGLIYASGEAPSWVNLDWITQDGALAAKWFKKAIEKGDTLAMAYLGWLYVEGRGVRRNYEQARQWFEKAAAAGEPEGMTSLGWMYYEQGHEVPKDDRQARQWFEKAAAAGNGRAMIYLGWMYEQGHGVSKDDRQARQWYEKAAAAGDGMGMSSLGWLYERGYGVPQDSGQARQWFEKAATHGDSSAWWWVQMKSKQESR